MTRDRSARSCHGATSSMHRAPRRGVSRQPPRRASLQPGGDDQRSEARLAVRTPRSADPGGLERAAQSAVNPPVVSAWQAGYAQAHELFSPQYDSLQSSGVAYCKTAADVALCLSFVTKFGLAVRMRSGGHSYGGWSSVTSGLILDVTEMTR